MSQEKAKQSEYGTELKLAAVRRVLAGESVSAVAQELGIRRKGLYVWKDRYEQHRASGCSAAWTVGGSPLPHSNAIVYKCNSITIDGQ